MIYEFIPTQDLHGYSKPWAPGAGKNLCDISEVADGKYNSSYNQNTADNAAFCHTGYIPVTAGRTYACSWPYLDNSGNMFAWWFTSDKSGISAFTVRNKLSVIATAPENAAYLSISLKKGENLWCQVEEGNEVTSWEPYSNICPIQGFDIWDPIEQQMVQVYAGYVNSNTLELYLRPYYAEYDGEELVGPWLSSLDEYTEEGTPTTGAQVVDLGGELLTYQITPFMLQTLLDSMGIRTHFTSGAGMLNKLMDQAQGRVRTEEELLHMSNALRVIPIGEQLPSGLKIKPITKDVLPGLPGKYLM